MQKVQIRKAAKNTLTLKKNFFKDINQFQNYFFKSAEAVKGSSQNG